MQGSASGIDGLFAKDLLLCPPAGIAELLPIYLTLRFDACVASAKVNPSHPVSSPVLYLKLFPTLIGSLASSWME
ncbi:hypothetical protein AAHC03_019499 [Spirometra sp. Aus1]